MVTQLGPEPLILIVSAADAGARVDRLVMSALGCTRSEAHALCAQGAVRLQGHRVGKGTRAHAGDRLEIAASHGDPRVADPDLPLDIALEREDVVVVRKPAGIPTVPLKPGERGTLAGALLARYPEMQGIGYGPREPGVIHRLDTQTSGLVVAARTAAAFAELSTGLRGGKLSKRYVAVVTATGLPEHGEITLPLAPDSSRQGRVIVAPDLGPYRRESHTSFRVLERGPRFALVEVEASRAFRHQVRAHLAAIGNPIAGDALYGGEAAPELRARHALHASYVAWAGERTPSFAVSDEPPLVFRELVRAGSES